MDNQIKNIPPDKTILLFDGVCNLCNYWVQFVLKRNKSRNIIFGSLQSQSGQALLKAAKLPHDKFDSIIVIKKGIYYTKSNAVFKIIKLLELKSRILILK